MRGDLRRQGQRRRCDGRSELQVLLDLLCAGDILVVARIDRLARSLRDLQNIVHELKARGVALKATEHPVDTGTAAGKAFWLGSHATGMLLSASLGRWQSLLSVVGEAHPHRSMRI